MKRDYEYEGDCSPISPWGYFWYNILFSIPVIGFIFLVVFALKADNVNLKNYARSFFCGLIISIIIIVILLATGLLATIIENLTNIYG